MSENFLLLHVNEWADFESSDAIPLSQGYILANLKKHGYNGQIVGDYKDRPLTPHHFHTCMQELHPKAIGFSVYEENINRVRAWAALAKKIDPEIPVVLGGPQTTFMPGEALEQMNEVDILCRGEGETVMLEIANALAGNRTFKDVAGICCRENGSIVETGICPGSENLDNLPSPYLDEAFDCRGKSRAILLSSRGCSSACTFCYTPRANGRKVRFHSVDRVVAEMQHLQG
ncbi:MAG: cobalamin-dependent protein, partial [Proteobacteria bacterium]|nr:cobalamin-dependent protein [Pseudomonadota bacterium]